MKKKISAEIVADSTSPQGHRITTFLLTYPRFIHGELMTHRLFSRNSASSRAIPFNKMLQMVEEDPFIPIAWQKDHKGMQGTEYITNPDHINFRIAQWINASKKAITSAEELNGSITKKTSWDDIGEDVSEGITKQLVNRLLEPFMWHTVLVTSTEWDNFFNLRCPSYGGFAKDGKNISFKSKEDVKKHFKSIGLSTDVVDCQDFYSWQAINTSGAEIHIQALAEIMWDSLNESTPKQLKAGEWHIPFGDRVNFTPEIGYYSGNTNINGILIDNKELRDKIKVATARCARLSYMTFDGEINYEKDIKLHDQLLESKHFSPFENCAKCMSDQEYYSFVKGEILTGEDGEGTIVNYEYYPYVKDNTWGAPASKWINFVGNNPNNNNKFGWCNNFRGFIQYRYMLENDITK